MEAATVDKCQHGLYQLHVILKAYGISLFPLNPIRIHFRQLAIDRFRRHRSTSG
jgi:hypothetical protein